MNLRPSLTDLAIRHQTDKWGLHFYTPHYERHFQHLRDEKINVLEIGVGGYEDPHKGGESLRMWRDFFPNASIYGIDIHNKSPHEGDRIRIFRGSQVDEAFLKRVVEEIGGIDLIIDDGSHLNSHIIETFKILFPLLKQNGIYAVEDIQTSYWNNYGGDSYNLKRRGTAMNFFKGLTDSLNFMEIDRPSYEPTYFDRNITGMSFYHNLVFIQKGANTETSNWVVNNRMRSKNEKAWLKYV
ncbi:MAG: class I SAM-dependent methyltransferase, partial [Proteobacteria bacterium]|nr:class I SAM-dependent methyltransferase [Pseudomonadota bacterium]